MLIIPYLGARNPTLTEAYAVQAPVVDRVSQWQVNNYYRFMDGKREYNYRIEPRDVDFTKRATLMSLADYILHAAGEDADRNGFGVRELNLHNASWVLTRMALETRRMPQEYENIRITTWVSAVSRAMTTRNFEVFDREGAPVAFAVTNWAMIDLCERRLLDLHTLPAYGSMVQDYPSPIELPRRLAMPVAERECEHRVVYSDLDFNCHTNSVKYIQWALDALPIDFLERRRFARTDVNFLQETRHGELLHVAGAGMEHCAFEILNSRREPVCRLAFETAECG